MVSSILRGEDIGCVNTGDSNEFDEISKDIIGYGCFKRVVFMALIHRIAAAAKEYRESNLINKDYVFDVFCEDEDYRLAFQLSGTLFPSVLSMRKCTKEGEYSEIDSVHAFRNIDKYDIENICDIFADNVRDYVKTNLEGIKTTEEATELIINGTITIPF